MLLRGLPVPVFETGRQAIHICISKRDMTVNCQKGTRLQQKKWFLRKLPNFGEFLGKREGSLFFLRNSLGNFGGFLEQRFGQTACYI